jgi:demethoxyubiquinone hydroxylase (CLK1/Coq7/Cat5 family)
LALIFERSARIKQQADYRKLVELLQLAYSAEMGAALVYRGPWRSISDERERGGIRRIEAQEWLHRREVGARLKDLLVQPRLSYEVKYFHIGRALGFLCHLAGWFLPMYGPGIWKAETTGNMNLPPDTL